MSVAGELGLNPVPGLGVDDRVVLSVVYATLVREPPDVDRFRQDLILRTASSPLRCYSARLPRAIVATLNLEYVPGPGGRPWGDTTIRGQIDRGTGILNNAAYVGRIEWNRCSYVRDPSTGKRVARPNPHDE